MSSFKLILQLLVIGWVSFGLAQDRKPIMNTDIVDMIKAKLPEGTIVLAIEQGPRNLDTSSNALIVMMREGASQRILDAMLKDPHGGSGAGSASAAVSAPFDARFVGKGTILEFHADGTWRMLIRMSGKDTVIQGPERYTYADHKITLMSGGGPIASGALEGNALDVLGSSFVKEDATENELFYALTPAGAKIALPSTAGEMKDKNKRKLTLLSLGVAGGSKGSIETPGDRCAVRIKQSDSQVFLMDQYLPEGASVSPRLATLYHLNQNRGTREVVLSDVTATMFTKRSRGEQPGGIRLDASRYDNQHIKIVPISPLLPGEYAFLSVESDGYQPVYRLHCFGVD